MTTTQVAEKTPVVRPAPAEPKPAPVETPTKTREEVLEEISQDSLIGPDEYLRDSTAPNGE